MNAEDSERLQACVQQIATLLDRNTPEESLTRLEGIKQSVRQHMLERVSPEVGVFLSQRHTGRKRGKPRQFRNI